MQRRSFLTLAALAPPFAPLAVRAQGSGASAWAPHGPVRLIVPFAPGGSQDVLGRLLAQAAAPILGQNVVVENRAGAGGVLGAEAVARAAPDGLTILLATAGQLTIAKAIGRRLSYDPITDFTPVLYLVDSPVALLAAPQLNVRDAADLLQRARQATQPLPYASTGIGTNTHLIMEDLKAREHLNVEHVPYRGAAAAFNDLAAGRIALMFVSVPSVLATDGTQFKVVAVTSRERFPATPEVPTLSESGVKDFEASIWTGLSAPKGTPAPVVARLADAFREAMASDLLRARLGGLGVTPNGADGTAFGAMLQDDLERWTRVAAPLHIQLD
ncbi:Bug family tripartite tricarboxylate transporter substrate binding protein [Pararoseomonas indoligenes]|uniref:Tripartite tricarboxylate transporter substrate binding protein n=1 Tax=Roseomonas indoligenes TaxID=2820811 RepID=A0A940N082_9PROT|nr:tripartite tricarboxylate transporter substrate binding protein [Pararoseomonas indoligenes]MBP0491932.1 tripartite tricarboxylate transporter substrate binding protein [Pararoseomonas indoligenes]